MHPMMETLEIGFQIFSIGAPCNTIDSCSRLTSQRGIGSVQEINRHMMVERREPLLRPLSRGLPYAAERM
jgi:hypothetical protein